MLITVHAARLGSKTPFSNLERFLPCLLLVLLLSHAFLLLLSRILCHTLCRSSGTLLLDTNFKVMPPTLIDQRLTLTSLQHSPAAASSRMAMASSGYVCSTHTHTHTPQQHKYTRCYLLLCSWHELPCQQMIHVWRIRSYQPPLVHSHVHAVCRVTGSVQPLS